MRRAHRDCSKLVHERLLVTQLSVTLGPQVDPSTSRLPRSAGPSPLRTYPVLAAPNPRDLERGRDNPRTLPQRSRWPVAGWAHHGRHPHVRAADVLGRVTLVTGKEEFLNERTVDRGPRRRCAAHDAEAELAETHGGRPDPGDPGGDGGPVAVLEHPLRRRARPGEPPRGVRRRAAGVRRGAGRGRRARARARRRPEGQRRADQAAQAGPGHGVEVRGAQGLGVPVVRRRRGAAARLDASTRRPPASSSRRSARTSAHSPRPPTSSPTTSRASR